jgi:hypothetical protein
MCNELTNWFHPDYSSLGRTLAFAAQQSLTRLRPSSSARSSFGLHHCAPYLKSFPGTTNNVVVYCALVRFRCNNTLFPALPDRLNSLERRSLYDHRRYLFKRFRMAFHELHRGHASGIVESTDEAKATGKIHGMAADAIREELGQQFPSIDALNQEYSFWKNVDKVVSDTITRRTGQAKPLGQKLAQAAGTGAGFVVGGLKGAVLGREAMAAVEKATTSTAWGTVRAVMKDRLADAMAAGDTQAVIRLTSRIAAAQAAQPSAEDESAEPYKQATAQRQ